MSQILLRDIFYQLGNSTKEGLHNLKTYDDLQNKLTDLYYKFHIFYAKCDKLYIRDSIDRDIKNHKIDMFPFCNSSALIKSLHNSYNLKHPNSKLYNDI